MLTTNSGQILPRDSTHDTKVPLPTTTTTTTTTTTSNTTAATPVPLCKCVSCGGKLFVRHVTGDTFEAENE
ncbi:hypothetical protein E2C01_077707 [Portunus trituberculatus]|uniref:Uncharacterized protein n=1 Tax=Portunus trituberculatus TaxID=210409 RepID=A0A5B7IQF1_PORTR|nr:hypothetical protein [Portunus trituberculatus]